MRAENTAQLAQFRAREEGTENVVVEGPKICWTDVSAYQRHMDLMEGYNKRYLCTQRFLTLDDDL